MKSFNWRLAVVVALVLAVVTATGVTLAAASGTPGSKANGFQQEFLSKLATNLGVTPDKLTAALQATKQQMLDEAVQQGKITQSQADRLASRPGLFPFGGGRKRGPGSAFRWGNRRNMLAQALGLTAGQLKSKLQSGEKLPQIISGQGMTTAQFQQKMLALEKQALTQAITDGKLTQSQADRILQRMQQRFNRLGSAPAAGSNHV